MNFLEPSSGFLPVPGCLGGLYTHLTVQIHCNKLPVQTLLALLLRDELSADEFRVSFGKLSSAERMQLLEQLDRHTSKSGTSSSN